MTEHTVRDGRRIRKAKAQRAGSGPTLSRRSFFEAAVLLGLGVATLPTRDALAWGSWSKGTSDVLKSSGLGDCLHEDITQICYASVVYKHRNNKAPNSLINPWAGTLGQDKKTAGIAGNTVEAEGGAAFASEDDLAQKLYRENLAYLRIGSYWCDAAVDTVEALGVSSSQCKNVAKFQGDYAGAWSVAEHVSQTHVKNGSGTSPSALVQFNMNERAAFLQGMLSATSDGSGHLSQSDTKRFLLQWMGVAYEYARTGEASAVSGVSQTQAQAIVSGLIDTFGQEDGSNHELTTTLKVGDNEATKKISTRKMRLRALGMLCHTMEDLWNPAHTCRVYREWDFEYPDYFEPYTLMAFANYRKQNGNSSHMNGYHAPYDRYAEVDRRYGDNRKQTVATTETLSGVVGSGRSLEKPSNDYRTLGLMEAIDFTCRLLEYFFEDKSWDGEVKNWVEKYVLHDCFDLSICDAGRRCLHSPTYIIAPVQDMKTAFTKLKLDKYYENMAEHARHFDEYQRWCFEFFDSTLNEEGSKYVNKVTSLWQDDWNSEKSLKGLVDEFYDAISRMHDEDKDTLLRIVGCNGCHRVVSMLGTIRGLLQEYSIDLRMSRNIDAEISRRMQYLVDFMKRGETKSSQGSKTQSSSPLSLFAPREALADEVSDTYVSSDMEILDFVSFDDGSHMVSVRDLSSLETSVMLVPSGAKGKDLLEAGASNLRITYVVSTEMEDDVNIDYSVVSIENPEGLAPMSVVVGTVTSVSEGLVAIDADEDGGEVFLQVADGASDLPSTGDYVCAYYVQDEDGYERMLDYYGIDRPQETVECTYPVVKVNGNGMWLLKTDETSTDYEGDGISGGYDGDDNLVFVEYGKAMISPVPQEGCMATVTYYDKDYYDGHATDLSGSVYPVTNPEAQKRGVTPESVSDSFASNSFTAEPSDPVLVGASIARGTADLPLGTEPTQSPHALQATQPTRGSADVLQPTGTSQGDIVLLGNDPTATLADYDSPDLPAYDWYADDYWYWDGTGERRHIAVSVQGSSEWAPQYVLLELFGAYLDDLKHSSEPSGSKDTKPGTDKTAYKYESNGDGTHRKYIADPKDGELEKCTYNSKGTCIHCGYVYKSQGSDVVPEGTEWYWPRTRYAQDWGPMRSGWVRPNGSTYRTAVPSNSTSGVGTSNATSQTPFQPGASGLPGGFATSTDAATPATGVAAAPAAGVATTGAVTGTAVSPVTALPNTTDVAAGLDALMSVSAIAGAALTACGLGKASDKCEDVKVDGPQE